MAKVFKLTDTANTRFSINYEELLNSKQLEAVSQFSGPMLCIAGAGSGKTRTLVYRAARMIESGISPDSILLLTFTRKAASSMLERVATLIGDSGKKISGGTYHSFASLMLRQYGKQIGLSSGFSIIDESDCADIINLIRAELSLNTKETRFPRKKTVLEIISKSVNLEKSVEEIVSDYFSHFSEHTEDLVKIKEIFQHYKRENALLDYDDLLVFFLKLLTDSPEANISINRRFKYLMADEYQDTNGLQAKITLQLGTDKKNIMVVGDDSQSIYSFRGARVRNILEFPEQFENCTVLKLERNYRSSKSILAPANNLMSHAKEGFNKKLYTNNSDGEKPAIICCEDEQEQAMFVAARILDLREQGIKLSDIAVLFRSGFHAYQLELELKRRNIPYIKWGGFNPLDQVSWLRILLLIEGIGTQTATGIFKTIKKQNSDFIPGNIKVRPKAKEGIEKLFKALKQAQKYLDSPPSKLLNFIVEYYFPILKKKFDDYPKRMKDIDALAVISQRFSNLEEFLTDLALEPPKDSVDSNVAGDDHDDEQLIISTIHSAKGLEWHSVFIIHALEGRFPSFNAMKTDSAIEEERRLMYVAMTRAKENLAISYPATIWDPVTGGILAQPSRFIDESGKENLEVWQISR
jgi:DNA helicase-2/ATP-dependent DNA helicase PcrA